MRYSTPCRVKLPVLDFRRFLYGWQAVTSIAGGATLPMQGLVVQ